MTIHNVCVRAQPSGTISGELLVAAEYQVGKKFSDWHVVVTGQDCPFQPGKDFVYQNIPQEKMAYAKTSPVEN